MKNKIVFFVTGLDSGGLENYLLRFLTYKAQNFEQIIVFCKGGKTGQLEEKYKAIPNLIIHAKNISFFNPKDYIYVYHYLKENRIKIVCDFTGNFAGLVLLTAKLAGVNKRISFYRGSTNHFQESFLKILYDKVVKKLTYKYATNILSNSKAAFDFFFTDIWRKDNRFQVIYNGIDASKFEVGNKNLRDEFEIPENAFVIGHTGRFNVAKNHDVIIKVAEILIKRYPDIYFILCGNGVRDNLENKLKEMSINQNIRLFNNREDIPVFLNTMDAYFFPSITEGQPNALIEAMITGLPIVASNIEPIIETTPSEIHQDLKNPLDVEGFTKLIEEFYLNKNEKKQNFSDWAIQKFNPEVLFNKFFIEL